MSLKCGSASGGYLTRQPISLKNISVKNFPYKRSLTEHQLREHIKRGNLLGYFQCDIELPKSLSPKFAYFPPIFKNTLVSKNDIGVLIKKYDEEDRLLSQPRKILLSSFALQNRTPITPMLLFYLKVGLFCK